MSVLTLHRAGKYETTVHGREYTALFDVKRSEIYFYLIIVVETMEIITVARIKILNRVRRCKCENRAILINPKGQCTAYRISDDTLTTRETSQ